MKATEPNTNPNSTIPRISSSRGSRTHRLLGWKQMTLACCIARLRNCGRTTTTTLSFPSATAAALVPNHGHGPVRGCVRNFYGIPSSSSSSSKMIPFRSFGVTTKRYWSKNDGDIIHGEKDKDPFQPPVTKRTQQRQQNSNSNQLDEFLAETTNTSDFFASSDRFPDFASIGVTSPVLLHRLRSLLSSNDSNEKQEQEPRPSAVQAAAYAAVSSGSDATIGAETGSGKTLAYLLPILDDILMNKQRALEQRQKLSGDGDDNDDIYLDLGYDYARAIILVPNKELANQVMRMALPLCGGDDALVWGSNGAPPPPLPLQSSTDITTTSSSSSSSRLERLVQTVRIGLLPGNLSSPNDYQPFRTSLTSPRTDPPLDLVVTTPASLSPLGPSPKNVDLFADVATLIIDEADMLLDGGYVRPLENVLLGFKRADRISARNEWDDENDRTAAAALAGTSFHHKKTQMVLVAATLPDVGLRSVEAYVAKKFPKATRVTMKGMHNARHYGIKNQSLWIEDDPQVFAAEGPSGVNRRRMEVLVHMLLGDDDNESASLSSSSLRGEKVMVFLNSVDDVDGATNALRRAGVNAVPYHAKIPLVERGENLNAFRRFVANSATLDHTSSSSPSIDQSSESNAVPVLVCTDLAARGLDVPGVTAVVQLQFAGNVVSHLHRMGRCGRAGNRDGRGVIFYDGGEGTEGDLVRVVREAEDQQEKMGLVGDYGGDDDDVEMRGEDDNDFASGHAGDGDRGKKGKVQNAFSRKRGFRKKRKKVRRSIAQEDEGDYYRAQNDDQIY